MGVFVLGMHRSGTSAVTRAINAFGVPLGHPADAIPPAPDNPEGFAESVALTQCNDGLLRVLGGRWDAPPDLATGWAAGPLIERERARAGQTFRDVYAGEHWVWKDPRLCLLGAFWDELLGGAAVGNKVVLVLREPRAVARSLERRDHLTKSYALALWERYSRGALAFAVGHPTLVANYDVLMSGPGEAGGWVAVMAAFLAGETDTGPFPEEAAARLRPSLDHHPAEPVAFDDDEDASPAQRTLYRAQLQLDLVSEPFSAPALPPETAATARCFAEHRACPPGAECAHRIPAPPMRQ